MTKVQVTAKRDFLETLTSSKPFNALSELIWNGFDSGSTSVQVQIDLNAIRGIETIRVRDFGDGIDRNSIEVLFGNLGDSWKKVKNKYKGRALHGKNGKGRFRAFALGTLIEWNTTYEQNKIKYNYKINGDASRLDNFEISDAFETVNSLGTEVIVSNLRNDFYSLKEESASLELAKIFAAYLAEYPGVTLEFNGSVVNPQIVQAHKQSYDLGTIVLDKGQVTKCEVTVIEWKIPTNRAVHLCDSKGIALHEIDGFQVRAPGFHFTAYIKSDHFRELDKDNRLILEDLDPNVETILKAAKNKIKEHFRRRLIEQQSQIVERWKNEDIYPYDEKKDLNAVEEVERQVFNIMAVNVENYLPVFEGADLKSKKFTFKLLAQAIRENPESVQRIIGEVLGLKKEDQDDLADLLNKTTLSSIISLAKIVANRLDFLIGLESLLFDKENKKKLLERDQLHKILENEAWLFDEEFSLSGSEQRLKEVLDKHLGLLGKREDAEDVKLPDGRSGRVDLMFHRVVQVRPDEYDYLIIELKRPSKTIDADVITQIKKYARAVAGDERFHEIPARWKFLAVSNKLDDFAAGEANQRNRPKGLVSDDAELNITVWAKPWSEIINMARARLHYVRQHLDYEADSDSSKSYLQKTYAKFIPASNKDDVLKGV